MAIAVYRKVSVLCSLFRLRASLSTVAQEMLGVLAEQLGLEEQLQKQFPLVPGSQCAADLQAFGAALQEGQFWALQSMNMIIAV